MMVCLQHHQCSANNAGNTRRPVQWPLICKQQYLRHAPTKEGLVQKYAPERSSTNTQELLTLISKEEVQPGTEKRRRTYWQYVLMICCCILAVTAASKAFLYLETKTNTVQSMAGSIVKDLATLKAQVTATDTREQLATVTAELENLKATNTRVWAEVQQLRETVEALKVRRKKGIPRNQRVGDSSGQKNGISKPQTDKSNFNL